MVPTNPEHTPIQRFRLDQEVWDEFGTRAKANGSNRSRELAKMVRWYIRERGAELPSRPIKKAVDGRSAPKDTPPAID